MAQIRNSIVGSFRAGASIPAYRIVAGFTISTANVVSAWDTNTKAMVGLSDDVASTNAAVGVIIGGTGKGECSASITCWKPLTAVTGTGALLESTDTAATVTTLVILPQIGIALDNGSASAVIEVLVRPTNFHFDF